VTARVPDTAVRVAPARAMGALAAPGSKSVTNRLLVLAALADGESLLRQPLDSDDSRAMRGLVEGLGATVGVSEEGWSVRGTGGRPAPRAERLDAALSGTTMRFGAALAALSPQPVEVSGAEPLLRRPIGPLASALRALGADVRDEGGFPPVRVGGGIDGGSVTVDVSASSQFASALLLVAPYARVADVRVELAGESAVSYVELTAQAMADWGVPTSRDGRAWVVPHGHRYAARDALVEYDASAAAHLFCVAMATGGSVTVTNVSDTLQADAGFPALCAAMGAAVALDEGGLTVEAPPRLAALGEIDLGTMPDQLPNVAVLAALAHGETIVRNVAVVRGHETDRISALHSELRRLGVAVEELPDGLRIQGGVAPPDRLDGGGSGTRVRTYDDHRIAMAFAALAARVPGIVIEEPWCVTKTYPAFWSDIGRLGLTWEAA
jgi:3-phosphoshikimate 1-carboxyvinyltransferase